VLPRLTRYLLRRWTIPLAAALLFYGCLLLANETVAISKEIFAQGAPLHWLPPLLLTSLPEILGMVLPMAAVLGGLLGTQQLLEGSELVAAQGLGAGNKTWIRPWLWLSATLVLLAMLNAHVIVPKVSQIQQVFRSKMAEEAKARFLHPGGPPWFPPGTSQSAFWVDSLGEIHVMEAGPQGIRHLAAKKMSYVLENKPDNSSVLELKLNQLQGVLYQTEGNGVIHLLQEEQILRFNLPSSTRLLAPTPLRHRPTRELIGSDDPEAALEWTRRIALPLASGALLLLGIGLGFGHPRSYKGGAILKSMGVIILYYLILKYLENLWINQKLHSVLPMLFLPLAFLIWGWVLLQFRLRPRRPSRFSMALQTLFAPGRRALAPIKAWYLAQRHQTTQALHGRGTRRGILRHWTTLAWWRNWISALGIILVLDLLIQYSSLAGDLSKNGVSSAVFLAYWLWNLPPLLSVALPIAFLLGSVLALSEAAISREWTAMRAGGVSLVQWVWSTRFAWGSVLVLTFAMQVWLAPKAFGEANNLYRKILNRSSNQSQVKPWLYLGSTGVLWNLQGEERWGFPLKAPGEAPILLRWRLGDLSSQALAWNGMRFVQGPPADTLFPDRALRDSPNPEQARTRDLFAWQKWAPDPERAHLLWSRLFGWLAGPCLLLSMLSFAFPGPRQGRGTGLGFALVAGLLYLGLQALFGGAARADELPPLWGVLGPYVLLLGFALTRIRKLRT
jgi:lipopolysaccharide export LptBFGC system permease protein LptF